MSQNIDLLRRVYDAWNREGLEAFETLRDCMDPAVESVEPPEFPGGGTYIGVEAWRAAMTHQLEGWDKIQFEPHQFLENDDKVMAATRVLTRGRSTQIETEWVIFHVMTVRQDRIVRFMSCFQRTPALEELGLPADEPVRAIPPRSESTLS